MTNRLSEECSKYAKLLKDTEELSPEMLAIAKEAFTEGWIQCEHWRAISTIQMTGTVKP